MKKEMELTYFIARLDFLMLELARVASDFDSALSAFVGDEEEESKEKN